MNEVSPYVEYVEQLNFDNLYYEDSTFGNLDPRKYPETTPTSMLEIRWPTTHPGWKTGNSKLAGRVRQERPSSLQRGELGDAFPLNGSPADHRPCSTLQALLKANMVFFLLWPSNIYKKLHAKPCVQVANSAARNEPPAHLYSSQRVGSMRRQPLQFKSRREQTLHV